MVTTSQANKPGDRPRRELRQASREDLIRLGLVLHSMSKSRSQTITNTQALLASQLDEVKEEDEDMEEDTLHDEVSPYQKDGYRRDKASLKG